MINKKRGQEEMVGFVLIMLVVAVIFIVILGIYARKPGTTELKSGGEVYHFLESLSETTSSCAIGYTPNYLNIGDLLERCLDDKKSGSSSSCLSGESVCEVMNTSVSEILSKSWNVGPEGSVKGYIFTSKVEDGSSRELKIELKEGECGFSRSGAETLLKDIRHSLIIC